MIVKLIYFVSAFDSLAFVMALTVMKSYMMSLGGTQFSMGLLESLVALISLIWNPIMGSLSDSRGRKPMLLISLFICLISNLMMIVANSFMVIVVARALGGFGSQIVGTLKATISDNVPSSDDQSKIIGRMQANTAISFIVGALFTGYLSDLNNGFTYIFIIVSLLFLSNIGLVSLLLQENRTTSKMNKNETIGFTSELSKAVTNLKEINWQKYWDIFISRLCIDISFGIYFSVFTLLLITDLGVKASAIGYIFAFMSISGIAMNLSMNKLKKLLYVNDKFGYTRLFHGMSLITVSLLGAAMSSYLFTYIFWLLPLIAARVLVDLTLNEVVLLKADDESKGRVIGATDSMTSLAGLIAPTLSGLVAYNFGNVIGIITSAIPTLIAAVLLNCLKNNLPKVKNQ